MIDSRPPSIYCASKLQRHAMWREWKAELSPSTIDIISTWHDNPDVENLELDFVQCVRGWQQNRYQVSHVDHLIVYAEAGDAINGTLVEIGMALMADSHVRIHLVGTYPWGTWRFFDEVFLHDTLHDALCAITGVEIPLPTKEHLLNDPIT